MRSRPASAVVLGLATLNARDAFVESASTDASARDRAIAFRTMTNIAWGGAALAAACAVPILVLTSRSTSTALSPRLRVGAGSVQAELAF